MQPGWQHTFPEGLTPMQSPGGDLTLVQTRRAVEQGGSRSILARWPSPEVRKAPEQLRWLKNNNNKNKNKNPFCVLLWVPAESSECPDCWAESGPCPLRDRASPGNVTTCVHTSMHQLSQTQLSAAPESGLWHTMSHTDQTKSQLRLSGC